MTREIDMQARMANPATIVPDAMQALLGLGKAINKVGVPALTMHLVYLRASQINGCSVCVDMHARDAKKAGASDEKIWAVGAWRETTRLDEAERAALALTDATTKLTDGPVPDDVYDAAAKHFDEEQLAALIMGIATVNLWNRLNAATRQVVS
ncbi:carboxymuconolactone decarboxylase family protein [Actinokineospora sp. HUAS TT18]|uniref:carboxymuconolactone decarboxylase family protein n=1 Tax=Actinokineospora sp. HUAS TT18 TaxID=3447451 RepID=UPI003F527047